MLKIDITQIIRNMKAFKLLVTLLLVALSMGVSSCSEELDNQPMVSYPEGDEPLDIVCKEYGISDYEDIELFYYYKNGSVQANFSGLRDSKLWLAAFNVEDKSPIINWTDELPFNRNRRIYKGYGEYEDVTIQQIIMLQSMYFNPSEFVVSLRYSFGTDYSYYALLFRQDAQTKEVQVKNGGIFAGFQYSIINDDCCYSLFGDTLYIAEKGFEYSNVGTLYTSEFISHEEAIYTHRDRDNKVSDWLHILVPFSDSHSDNYNLSVGQSVLVLSLPDMQEQGYILGCPMRPSSIIEGEVKRTFSDGGFYSYSNGVLTISPVSKVVINANVEINGDVKVSGTTITGGNINLNSHKHSGVAQGGAKTGGPE